MKHRAHETRHDLVLFIGEQAAIQVEQNAVLQIFTHAAYLLMDFCKVINLYNYISSLPTCQGVFMKK